MSDIVGKWVLQEGTFKGLWFEFNEDGTYDSELPRLVKIKASGTYTVSEGGLIDTNQTQHTMNLVGQYAGRYAIEDDTLKLIFGPVPGGPRPEDLSKAGVYKKEK
ncbi:MAG: hypothetical protein ABIJ39_09175 [Chloroflexota bacterium]